MIAKVAFKYQSSILNPFCIEDILKGIPWDVFLVADGKFLLDPSFSRGRMNEDLPVDRESVCEEQRGRKAKRERERESNALSDPERRKRTLTSVRFELGIQNAGTIPAGHLYEDLSVLSIYYLPIIYNFPMPTSLIYLIFPSQWLQSLLLLLRAEVESKPKSQPDDFSEFRVKLLNDI